jgi:hypothetical protein
MAKVGVWLSYDLGLRGDYDGLYYWLDRHGAKECGEGVAFFSYDFRSDPFTELRRDLRKAVRFDRRDRVYAVCAPGNRVRGRFLIGGRKQAAWHGLAELVREEVDA